MILIDSSGHMVSDTSLEELHAFARRIDLGRSWFRGVRRRHPHYDLTTPTRRAEALYAGAKEVSSADLARRMVRR